MPSAPSQIAPELTAANDNEPRSQLAEQLIALLEYRNRPDHKPEPLTSNWSTVPANDNQFIAKTECMARDRLLRDTPSLPAICREMGEIPVRNDAGQIVAIGKLRFSDGTQTEKAFTIGPDGDVIPFDCRLPAGAMLGCKEQLTSDAGGRGVPAAISNGDLARRFGVQHRDYVVGGRRRRGRSYSRDESVALLAEAVSNTETMPPVTICPPGLAAGTWRASDCFIGMKTAPGCRSGAINWQDLYSAGRDHEDWIAAVESLSPQDRIALDTAMSARSLADISPGGTARGARKRGKKLLVAANDNLADAMKKLAV